MQIIERKECAIGGLPDLEHLHTFSGFPVFMGCTAQDSSLDLKEDMSWYISRSSGLIQLKKLLPPDILYPESHGAGEVGALWSHHHKEFAKFIKQFQPKSVFEIGGAHGILEKEYNLTDKVEWTILEPNPSPVEGCNAKFIKGFFNENFKFDHEYDAVVHSHVFEHIYDPNAFIQQLSDFMIQGKKLIFSLPNMRTMLERKYTNCINFEHTIFLTEPYVEYLMAKFGFRALKKEYFQADHSIFYAATRDDEVPKLNLDENLYEINKKIFGEYIQYHQELVLELNKKIEIYNGPIFLFGAHVFSQYLIEFGLNKVLIKSLLDNNVQKQGKRLYGTTLQVESPSVLAEIQNPAVILRAGVYNEEIKQQILSNESNNVTFF